MVVALIQQTTFVGTGSTTVSGSMPSPAAAGNALVAWFTDPSVSSTRGKCAGGGVSWFEVSNRGNANELVCLAGFGATGAGGLLTFTFDNSGNHAINVSEWSGIGTMDQVAQNGQSVTNITVGPLVPSPQSVLVLAAFDINAVGTWGAAGGGFTNLTAAAQGNAQVQAAYNITAGVGPFTASWTQSVGNSDDAIAISFLPPSLGGGFIPPAIQRLRNPLNLH